MTPQCRTTVFPGLQVEVLDAGEALDPGDQNPTWNARDKLAAEGLFATRKSREKDPAFALVAGRVLHPGSKLSLSRLLDAGSRASTLGQVLGVEGADENELYGAMDWQVARQNKIEDALAKSHLTNGYLVLYDVPSSYFEGKTCPLARFGYGRDHRGDRMQITEGLLCSADGWRHRRKPQPDPTHFQV